MSLDPHLSCLAEGERSALQSVVTNRRNPQNGELGGSTALRWEALLTPKNRFAPHMCYHVKFYRSASNGVSK